MPTRSAPTRSEPTRSQPTRLFVANRSEIAVRIRRAADELGLPTVLPYSADDAGAPWLRGAATTVPLAGSGPAAYLDVDAVVAAALDAGCDALHPGYGLLSERAELAAACDAAGIVFVGPAPSTLAVFGDKHASRELAVANGVPVIAGTGLNPGVEEICALMDAVGGAVVVKAVAGGGGRGMRVVAEPSEVAAALQRCREEAAAAFGVGDVIAEQALRHVRHLEVQVLGDGVAVVDLGERDCSVQRRHQKLVEIAPAPGLSEEGRERLAAAARTLAAATGYRSAGTFEFLVGASGFWFIEANARLQVEHTVTEEITGVDIVVAQLRIASGETLEDLGLTTRPVLRGCAVQWRVNAETIAADGSIRPSGGTVRALSMPAGPGIRIDTGIAPGWSVNPRFDSLLAKLVVRAQTWPAARTKAVEALGQLRIEGVTTNAALLAAIAVDDELLDPDRLHVTRLDERIGVLAARAAATEAPAGSGSATEAPAAIAATRPAATALVLEPGQVAVPAPLIGTVVAVPVAVGDAVRAGQEVAVLEAMKMQHGVVAPVGGVVQAIVAAVGETVEEGAAVVVLAADAALGTAAEAETAVDLDRIRPDLASVIARHAKGLDEHRPEAVARRHAGGSRTARENVADLVDPGSLVEYGPLVIAAQRKRRSVAELIDRTPGDGMVGGLATVNAGLFGDEAARCVVASYDYMVLAGTQGTLNHRKKDRLFDLAERWKLPTVVFAEGGGGRPGDTDQMGVSGLDCLAFWRFGRLSGLVPLVGITNGYCFAGNAALLGCCDVIIATKTSSIGMGGPAMIEGGGLGVHDPRTIGPMSVQVPNGVVDIAVEDEAEAVAVAKRYLGYFQGVTPTWACADQRALRHVIPENRVRAYDIRVALDLLADRGSVLELRPGFGKGMITAFARVEGRPIGVIANDPRFLGGAIAADEADKAARFMQLCDAFAIPLLFLCDTPGFMVGPEAEKAALVRHVSRMFVTAGGLSVPFFTVVLRKGYGLGAQGMAGGSFQAPGFIVGWPTSEFGGMGLEGAVRLGYRKELEAIADPDERARTEAQMIARMYEIGKGENVASYLEIDDVIDPADTRAWITAALRSIPPGPGWRAVEGKRRPMVDTW